MPFIRGLVISSQLLDDCPALRDQLPLLCWGGLRLAELRQRDAKPGQEAGAGSAAPAAPSDSYEGVDLLWLPPSSGGSCGSAGSSGSSNGQAARAGAGPNPAADAEAAAAGWAAGAGLSWPDEVVLLAAGQRGSDNGGAGGTEDDALLALLARMRARWRQQQQQQEGQGRQEAGGSAGSSAGSTELPPWELPGYGGGEEPAWERLRLALGHANLRRAEAEAGPEAAGEDKGGGLVLVLTAMKASRERDLAREGLLNLVPQDGVVFAPLDPSLPPAAHLPFSALLHKASDELEAGPGGVPRFGPRVAALAAFAAAHPHISLVDPLEAAAKVTQGVINRAELARVCGSLSRLDLPTCSPAGDDTGPEPRQPQAGQGPARRVRARVRVRAPRSTLLESFTAEEVAAAVARLGCPPPYIVKPLVACGTADSHRMALAAEAGALAGLTVPLPAMLQEFVNHDALIYKVYVAGEAVFHTVRPSIPNLAPAASSPSGGGPASASASSPAPQPSALTLHGGRLEFDSLKSLPTPSSLPSATAAIAATAATSTSAASAVGPTPAASAPSQAVLEAVAAHLRSELGLSLFGFDVVVASGSGGGADADDGGDGDGGGGAGRKRARAAEEAGRAAAESDMGCMEVVVVDVNYFPSFRGAPQAAARFRAAVLQSHRRQQQQRRQ
ncbi:hypothetical protein GPECTOR_449g344 [Gonium pectorale]|uniref:inositol-1,3,4-trisphosphate 5/6-kinase n=1 Tax=Gonium pectorale TaxID=33097 RepID=A0A150FV65_GONPE|nr:hypothetical protein GPECTOR_449g344 [Gonium pectorale]|eukprot:KXZ41468.1 hypothetical protein GPECTOR_449g344 [Gonium pectorale]